jgi:uncharacterized protein YbjT (DUF2867 family)
VEVVVLGGSGRLGRALLPQLAAQGLTGLGVGRADGLDLRGRTSLRRAADEVLPGADVLVHCATDLRHPADVDVDGTAKLVAECARHSLRHLVFVSVVGTERTPWRYLRAKAAAEQVVRASGVPFTIVRATPWFESVAATAERLSRFGVAPRGWTVAPCDVSEVAMLIVRRAMAPARNAVVEFGGPQTVTLARAAREVGGHRVLHLGVPGALSAAVRSGALLPGPGALVGSRSWTDWLATRS